MKLNTQEVTQLAEVLDTAMLEVREIERLTVKHPELSLPDAYAIQAEGVKRRQTRGEMVIGYKMGLTSQAKREQMGLHTPIFGVLTNTMQVQNGGEFSLLGKIHPKIEPEIAFVLSKPLKGKVTEKNAWEYVAGVAAAMEILDSRFVGFKYFSLPDVVADNSSSAYFVMGPVIPTRELPADFKLDQLEMVMSVNGEPSQKALSNVISGNPILSLVQLSELLAEQGIVAPEGSIVLAGAATQAVQLEDGQSVRLKTQSLPDVKVTVVKGAAFAGEKPVGTPSIYGKSDLTYNGYLKIPELLSLQKPLSEPEHHDEMLFIVIHQAYELWFKLMLHELTTAREKMQQKEVLQAHHFIKRVVEIMRVLVQQIHILETMTPADFLKFRDRLNPASGFQSLQFRELEFLSGLKDERMFMHFKNRPEMTEVLQRRMNEPDLRSTYIELLTALGIHQGDDVVQSLVPIYQKPENHLPLYLLSEALVDFDTLLIAWREHHVRVVERVIGFKMGTGGSSGVEYLRKTLSKKCFPELWEVRSRLV